MDRNRLCVTCGTRFMRSSSEFPNHCSEVCHTEYTQHRCLNCKDAIEKPNRFCSSNCMSLNYGTVVCNNSGCEQIVSVPHTGPFMRMPKYCSSDCRNSAYYKRTGNTPKPNHEQSEFLKNLGDPVDVPPLKVNGYPYTNIHSYMVPELNAQTATARCLASWDLYQNMLSDVEVSIEDLCYMGLQPQVFSPETIGIDRFIPWLPASAVPDVVSANATRIASIRLKGAKYQNELMRLLEYIGYFWRPESLNERRRKNFVNKWVTGKPEYMGKSLLYVQCLNFIENSKPVVFDWVPNADETIPEFLFGNKYDLLESYQQQWSAIADNYEIKNDSKPAGLGEIQKYIDFVESREERDHFDR